MFILIRIFLILDWQFLLGLIMFRLLNMFVPIWQELLIFASLLVIVLLLYYNIMMGFMLNADAGLKKMELSFCGITVLNCIFLFEILAIIGGRYPLIHQSFLVQCFQCSEGTHETAFCRFCNSCGCWVSSTHCFLPAVDCCFNTPWYWMCHNNRYCPAQAGGTVKYSVSLPIMWRNWIIYIYWNLGSNSRHHF